MKHKVIVVDDKQGKDDVLATLKRNLEQRHVEVDMLRSGEEALARVRSDNRIVCVLLDYYLKDGDTQKRELIDELRRLKPGLPVIYMTVEGYGKLGEDGQNDYVSKKSLRLDVGFDKIWQNNIKRHIDDYCRAPFFAALKDYCDRSPYSWHTPGHSGGTSFAKSDYTKEFLDFFGENVFKSDLSVSVPDLGSLLESSGPIGRAEKRASETFGSARTYFVTNGTSSANKMAIQALVSQDDTIIVDRNCHKSVHHAVMLCGAEPVYLRPTRNRYGMLGPIPLDVIRQKVKEYSNSKLLVITNCTYDGLVYDIAEVVKVAHASGIKVLVDEAWFAYARFLPDDAEATADIQVRAAMDCGADFATHSTHKVLSAFSQGSMLHVGKDVDAACREYLDEIFMMHTSTSPQYAIIASLDVATQQLRLDGRKLMAEAAKQAEMLRKKIEQEFEKRQPQWFRVLEQKELVDSFSLSQEKTEGGGKLRLDGDNVRLDPLKITISTADIGVPAKLVQEELALKGFQVEKTSPYSFLILVTMGVDETKAGSFFGALREISIADLKKRSAGFNPGLFNSKAQSELAMIPSRSCSPHKAFFCEASLKRDVVGRLSRGYECVALDNNAEGRTAAFMVVPYPPGVPVLLPGERIERCFVKGVTRVLEENKRVINPALRTEIHGLRRTDVDGIYDGVYVLKER